MIPSSPIMVTAFLNFTTPTDREGQPSNCNCNCYNVFAFKKGREMVITFYHIRRGLLGKINVISSYTNRYYLIPFAANHILWSRNILYIMSCYLDWCKKIKVNNLCQPSRSRLPSLLFFTVFNDGVQNR